MGAESAASSVRFVHAIRDPMEVVVSGYMYHLKTTEKWALRPEKRWNGTSYVKWLNALPLQEGLMAELHHSKRDALKTMPRLLSRTAPAPCTLTLRFESFASDWTGATTQLWNMLGVSDPQTLAELARRTAKHNVWSGRGASTFNKHVSSASEAKRDRLRSTLLNGAGVREQMVQARQQLGYPVEGDPKHGVRSLMAY